MNKYFILFLLLGFLQSYPQSNVPDDYILPLPAVIDSVVVSKKDLTKAIYRLHNFSEYIYNPVKITKIDSVSYSPKNLTDAGLDNRWGEGSWGRGLFSKFVDRYLFENFKNPDYNSFYFETSLYNGNNLYWGTHPIIAYCSRTMRAYVNIYDSSEDDLIKSFCLDRIINGSKYLMSEQTPNGGYIQWHWRKYKNLPNSNDDIGTNYINSYATANAIISLEKVYDLFKQKKTNNSNFLDSIYSTIEKAGYFLTINANTKAPINYVAFSIWGLVGAYKITKEKKFLETAVQKYSSQVKDFQDEFGAWYIKSEEGPNYHDSHPAYMGIILRALIELYDELPESYYHYVKIDLKKSIVKGINHFLYPGIVHHNFPNQKIRLGEDGGLFAYERETEYVKSEANGLQLILALIFAIESKDLFSNQVDINRLINFIDVMIKYQVDATIKIGNVIDINSDIFFESLTRYFKYYFVK
jgi:hypothetical protein